MRIRTLVLSALLLWTAQAPAQVGECPPIPSSNDDIAVAVEIPPYGVSHALSASVLTGRYGTSSLEADVRVEGDADIGQAELLTEYESLTAGWSDDPEGAGCLALRLTMTLRYEAPITLYVASDYPRGSACYEAVLRHEQQHYEVTAELAKTFGRRLKNAIEKDMKIAKTSNPIRFETRHELGEVERLSLQRAQRVVDGFLRRLDDDIAAANERLDTPWSYEKVYAGCTD
jgi:hypothetical protein